MLRCALVFQNENIRDYGDWQQEKLAFCHGGVGIGLILFELKGIQQEIRAGLRKSKGPLVITFFFFFLAGWLLKWIARNLKYMGSTGGLQVWALSCW